MPAVLLIIRFAVLFLLDAIFFVQIAASLGRTIPRGRIIVSGTLPFFIVLAIFLAPWDQIILSASSTPWTLENPETGERRNGWADV
jgi:hypothetical protein